ncbi:MAG: 3'-5' exonuclease [Motiliproteus sp.]
MSLINYFHPLSKLKRQRQKLAQSDFCEPLRSLIRFPIWPPQTSLDSLEFLVVDFETSGLDIHQDTILSIGWVVIKGNQIHLDSAQRIDILAADRINAETAVINHIVPETLVDATPIKTAVEELFDAMSNRVVVAHCVPIERGFLNQHCRFFYNAKLPQIAWLDTLVMEGSLQDWSSHNRPSDFGLSTVRKKYGLPGYPAHDALIDAVATAELFLAQIGAIFGQQKTSLGVLMKRSLPD